MMRQESGVPRARVSAFLLAAVFLFMLPLNNANAFVSNRTIEGWTVTQPPIGFLSILFPGDPIGTVRCDTLAGIPINQTIGGERDLQISLLNASSSGFFNVHVDSALQQYIFAQDPTIYGPGLIQWDGVDGLCTLNPTGLGGIDLTDGDRITFTINQIDHPSVFLLVAYTDGANFSTYSFIQPPSFVPVPIEIKFTDFVVGGGTGVDWSNIGALEMQIIEQTGEGNLDFTLGPIVTQCPECNCNSLTATPPSILFGQTTTLNWNLSVDPGGTIAGQVDDGVSPPIATIPPKGLIDSVVTPPLFANTTFYLTAQTPCGEECPCQVDVTVGACECPVVNSVTAVPDSWNVGNNVHLCWDTTPYDAIPTVVHVDAPGYGPGVDLPEDGCIDFVADKLNYCADAVNGCPDAPSCHGCVSATPHTIPTFSGWGIGALLLLMAGSAMWLIVKRKRATIG